MKRALAAVVLAVAVFAGGCGSGSGQGPGDPAQLAPASTLAYFSFELAPEGDEKADFEAAFGKLLGPDPQARMARALVEAIKEEGSPLTYERDVKPWLGDSAAVVLTSIGRGDPDFALMLASTDDDKARDAIEKDVAGREAPERSYRGVEYRVLDGTTANGVVGHYLVAGTERAFKAVVDAEKDDKALADTDAWKKSVGDRGEGKVGLGFFDLKATIQNAMSQLPGAERVIGPLALGLVQLHPFVATVDAQPDALVVDVSSPGTRADKRGPGAASSPLIETLPGDAWLALALPRVGQALEKVAAALKLNPLIAEQYARIATQLRRATGLDLERDVLAGIGDLAAFARGSSVRELSGGLVVAARDRAALRRTLSRVSRMLARSHDVSVTRRAGGFDVSGTRPGQGPVEVRAGGPGAVAGYGHGFARSALAPPTRLGTSDLFRKATAELGARPTLFVAVAPVLALIGEADTDHEMSAEVRERLGHFDYLTVGARHDDGADMVRAVLGLH